MVKIISIFVLFILSFGLSSCATGLSTTDASTPSRIKNGMVELGGTSTSFAVGVYGIGPIIFYLTASFHNGGTEKLKNNAPTTEVAQASSDDIKLTIIVDGFSEPTKKAKNVIDHLQRFSERFTKALSEQREITWNNSSKKRYDFRLYYIYSKYKITQRTIKRLNSPTLQLSFYRTTSSGLAEKQNANSLAHESYHLEVSKIISKIIPNYQIKTSRGLYRVLEEVSAKSFGFCTAMRSESAFDLQRVAISPIKQKNKQIRNGTMSDAQMRKILQDETRIKLKDVSTYGSALFLSLWDEYAGKAEEIKREDPAADKFFDLCANNIAHPHDIWPVLWQLANDGRDANEFMTSAERAKIRAVERVKRKAAGS